MKKKWSLLLMLAVFITATLSAQNVCISGNCENGKGRLKVPAQKNYEFEGFFKDGKLKGEAKVYSADGFLRYTGTLLNFLPNGDGIKWDQKANKEDYVMEEGEYENDYLIKGTTYISSGKLIASGEFVPGQRYWLKSGFGSLVYRGKMAYEFCEKWKLAPGGPDLDGKVTVRDGDPKKGLLLSEAMYVNGKREGPAKEYDNESGVYHVLTYKNDEPAEGGKIYRIVDDVLVATDVNYAADAQDYLANSITFLVLRLNNTTTQMVVPEKNGAPFKKFQEKNEGKSSTALITPTVPANLKFGRMDALDNARDDIRAGKYTAAQFNTQVKGYDELLKYVNTKIDEAAVLIRNATRASYSEDVKKIEKIKDDALTRIDNYERNAGAILPDQQRNELKKTYNSIRTSMYIPARATLKN